MARPPKPLVDDVVYAMAERGWSDESIGDAFNVSHQTIRRRYGQELERCRNAGKSKLLDLMYEMAFKDRDVQAAKYLCDRRLGPIERKATITVQDAQQLLESQFKQRGFEIDNLVEALALPEPEESDQPL
jgi:AraC-like DNA-binding protein